MGERGVSEFDGVIVEGEGEGDGEGGVRGKGEGGREIPERELGLPCFASWELRSRSACWAMTRGSWFS